MIGDEVMIERQGLIKFNGKDVSVKGKDLHVGDRAPEFIATDQDWDDVDILKQTTGKIRIIASVLSLETDVCDRETRKFNLDASQLSKDIIVIVVSADLPFTQKHWCGAAGIDQILVVSDHKKVDFGEKYACLLPEPRVLRRAVFVVDRDGLIRYVQYLPELGMEPDYKAVLSVAKALV
jgi:thioredoxin-dependent peroxiredoxin